MRLFIAIDLPLEVKEELKRLQSHLNGEKLSFAKDFHITLMFLGEVTPERADYIKAQLQKAEFKPYTTAISSIGTFSSRKQLRTVWADISPQKETIELEQQISGLLPEYKEKREFSAHITLARVKYVKDKKAFIDSIKNIKVNKLSFSVSSFKLKKSTLTPQGPVYEDFGIYSSCE